MCRARGVEDERGQPASRRFVPGRRADLHRPLRGLAHHRDPELGAQGLELFHRRGPVHVGGREQRMLSLLLEVARELRRARRLARALQAHQHHDRRRVGRHRQAVGGAAEQLHQLVAHHLDHLLPGRQRLEHVLPDRLDADPVDEALHDLEIDVGLQQGHAHFAQGLLDVLLRQPAESAEPIEDAGQTVGQAIEHRVLPPGDSLWKR